MSAVRISGLSVLTLYCSDLERTLKFYLDVLNFKRDEDMPPGVLLSAGDITLYIERGRGQRKDAPGNLPEFSPCFATDSVQTTFQEIQNQGVEIIETYQEFGPEFAMFKIADPDGIILEFAGKP